MNISLTDIENAFQPAKEVDDPERFAGRKEFVEDCYLALIGEGTNIAIVGNRGIGKTSLARQVSKLATGNIELLDRFDIQYEQNQDFMAIYYACGNSIKTIAELLERLITTSNCLGDWIYDIPKAKQELTSYSPEFSAKIFGAGVAFGGERTHEASSSAAVSNHALDTVFSNICHAIISEDVAKDGILIIIDEFDQVEDPSGMAKLIKAMATNVPKVKFCIVGVAQDVRNLMKEHESSDRLFAGSIIQLPSMEPEELIEIIRIAERAVHDEIKFDDDATNDLVKLSRGHPYMVHLIGKYALRQAYREDANTITSEMISETLRSVAERRADPILESRYLNAITSSPQRESVLRALAVTTGDDGESWTSNAYKNALDDGVDNASQYVGQLVSTEYGAEIEKVRDRYYRFKDSLFLAYVTARPRQYDVT